MAHAVQRHKLLRQQIAQPSRSGHQQLRPLCQFGLLAGRIHAAAQHHHTQPERAGTGVQGAGNLRRQLAGRHQHHPLNLRLCRIELL